MKGTLGKLIPAANTLTTVCTITNNCSFGEINILVTNPNVAQAIIDVAIAVAATPNSNEYIYKSYPLPAATGPLAINNIIVTAGELVVVRSDIADTIFRVYGKETVE